MTTSRVTLRTDRLLQLLSVALCGLGFLPSAQGQLPATIWSGPTTTFTKADWADWTLPANQDRLTPNVWLTRKDSQALFNIAQEAAWGFGSPANAEWAFAGINGNPSDPASVTAANYASLNFAFFKMAVQDNPPDVVGAAGVLHLISENIYLDITFTSWTRGAGGGVPLGGGFSYERATPVPEPAAVLSGALMGLLGLGLALYHRRQARA